MVLQTWCASLPGEVNQSIQHQSSEGVCFDRNTHRHPKPLEAAKSYVQSSILVTFRIHRDPIKTSRHILCR